MLQLEVIELTCAGCGNRWTHSRTWHKATDSLGYSIYDPAIHGKDTYHRLLTSHSHVDGCHRCVPLQLDLTGPSLTSWIKLNEASASASAQPSPPSTKGKKYNLLD